ncbi:MAG: DUF2167 domain-containing protein [Verrucomicrobiaceae bacterium]
MKQLLALSLAFFICGLNVFAQEKTDEQKAAEAKAKIEEWAGNLKFQTGKITIKSGLATLNVPEQFKYLNPADSRKLLTLFGNPPSENLGIIFPAGTDLLKEGNHWFVVLQFEEDGYVKDNDADKINYTDLLKQMKDGAREANAERTKQGYPGIEIVGWAAPPRYDKGSHKLYWAKEIKFEGEPENTLNYNIRMLGRRGVLVANAVSSIGMLPEIEAAAPQILAMVDFNEGHRYTDFNSSTDKTAAYGIAALVAGGIAAKAGLFKGLWIALLAAKKFVIIGLVAVAGVFKKLWTSFTGRKQQDPPA